MNRSTALQMVVAFAFTGLAVRGGGTSPADVWADAAAKRATLPSFHQEFEETVITKTQDHNVSMKERIELDVSNNLWRTRVVNGSETLIRIFDGANAATVDEGAGEYVV